jgi:GxxExxY protein
MIAKKQFEPIPREVEKLASKIVEAAFRVHRTLGPGLLESVYEAGLCHELSKMGVCFEQQMALPVKYDGLLLPAGLRLDLWADRQIIIEIKSVEKIVPVHKAQLLTYMKLSESRLGFLLNFNVARLKDGITRMVL